MYNLKFIGKNLCENVKVYIKSEHKSRTIPISGNLFESQVQCYNEYYNAYIRNIIYSAFSIF